MCTNVCGAVSGSGRDDVSAMAGVLLTSFAQGGNQIQVRNVQFSEIFGTLWFSWIDFELT